MKTRCLLIAVLLILSVAPPPAMTQSQTALTYQGYLSVEGQPANGYFDLKFSLYGVSAGGGPVANVIAKLPTLVTNGLFTTTLDFGAAGFPGENRWLEIAVRPTGSRGEHVILSPRQRISATPYALQAASVADGAVTAGKLSAGSGVDGQVLKLSGGQLIWDNAAVSGDGVNSIATGLGLTGGPITNTGTLAIDTSIVPRLNAANAFANPGNSFNGTFAGNGANVTDLNAANLSSGTVGDARLSTNVALRGANQTFSGINAFTGMTIITNPANTIAGTFSGNGAGLTSLSGAALQNDSVSSNKLDAATRALLGGSGSSFNPALPNNYNGSFTGNGAGLTNLNAANLASGSLSDTRLSPNVALRGASQTFSGVNSFAGATLLTNVANAVAGSFSGNGAGLTSLSGAALQLDSVNSNKFDAPTRALLGGGSGFNPALPNDYNGNFVGNGAALTNLNAVSLAAGTLSDARLSVNVALRGSAQSFTASNVFSGVVTATNVNNRLIGSFIGNGAGLSNVAATLTNNLSGDVTGPPAATTVAGIRGVNVAAVAPSANQHLRYSGSAWTPGVVALGTDVSGTLALANGGTGAGTAAAARGNLGAAASGANADITSLTGLTTPLAATRGGSGLSSFATGDLLFANSSSSLARLADVATGNALISGGVGTAPAWGKVGLTTHVNGTLPVANGGTAGTTASAARSNLGAAASGANSDITSLAGLTTPLSPGQGGLGLSTFAAGDLLFANNSSSIARLADVATGNVLLSGGVGSAPAYGKVGLTTHVAGTLPVANGGTGAGTAAAARSSLGAAASGANADINSLSGLSTPLSPSQGGSGQSAFATGDILFAPSANALGRRGIGAAGTVLTSRGGVPIWTNANDHNHFGQVWTANTATDGLYVQNTSTDSGAAGLTGIGTANNSLNYGVFGQSSSSQGTGVQGLVLSGNGFTVGVNGQAASTDGTGVYGVVTATSGSTTGVIGESNSSEGTGVFGQVLATSGTTVGVYGYVASVNGYGLYTPNRLYAGNNAYVGGHLTIGTGARIQADVGTSNAPSVTFFNNQSSGMYSPAANMLGFVTSGSQRVHVAADGKVGIGRVATANRLEVEGEASKTTASGWLANSDAAIKREVRPVRDALDRLEQVRPVAFRYTEEYLQKHPAIEDKVYYNVIAQEFAQVFPEAVKSSGEMLAGREILQVDTYPAAIYSIAAIRELHAQVQARDQELGELRRQNQLLEARLRAIENRLGVAADR